MNPAQQALDLLYNRVRLADVEAMTDAERRQFAETFTGLWVAPNRRAQQKERIS